MLSRLSPSPALRRTVLPASAVAAFVLVYAAAKAWLAQLQACRACAELLSERGELDRVDLTGYRHRAGNGDAVAAVQLAFLLRELGRPDEAMTILFLPVANEHVVREAFGFLADERRAAGDPGAGAVKRKRRSVNEWADDLADKFLEHKFRVMGGE